MNNGSSHPLKTFFPNLDGLRFFAFLSVFSAHCIGFMGFSSSSKIYVAAVHFLSHGDLGVNFFFVLSGFLITYLLLQELKSENRINIPFFYVRRILRIWPLYF